MAHDVFTSSVVWMDAVLYCTIGTALLTVVQMTLTESLTESKGRGAARFRSVEEAVMMDAID